MKCKLMVTRWRLEKIVLAVTVEEDMVYGTMDRLSRMLATEGWEMWVEDCVLAMAGDLKKELLLRACVDENANPRNVEVLDLNEMWKQMVLSATEVVMELGEHGWIPWDSILDSSFNRWVLQDLRDKVRFEYWGGSLY